MFHGSATSSYPGSPIKSRSRHEIRAESNVLLKVTKIGVRDFCCVARMFPVCHLCEILCDSGTSCEPCLVVVANQTSTPDLLRKDPWRAVNKPNNWKFQQKHLCCQWLRNVKSKTLLQSHLSCLLSVWNVLKPVDLPFNQCIEGFIISKITSQNTRSCFTFC